MIRFEISHFPLIYLTSIIKMNSCIKIINMIIGIIRFRCMTYAKQRDWMIIHDRNSLYIPSTINRHVNPIVFWFSIKFDSLSRNTDRLKQFTGNAGALITYKKNRNYWQIVVVTNEPELWWIASMIDVYFRNNGRLTWWKLERTKTMHWFCL